MNKKKAFQIVFYELIKCPMFMGEYDAKNGDEHFMHGIATVMERIAYELDEDQELLDAFSDLFDNNMYISKMKAKEKIE